MGARGATTIPQMRASHMRANVSSLAGLGEENEAKVRAACPDTIAEIDAAIRSAWLPLKLDLELTQCVEDVCGREAAKEWARQAILASMRGTLLGPVLVGLIRLGLGPQHGLRRVPGGWNLIYKNCGEVTCEARVGRAELVVREVPPETFAESYVHGIGAAFEGIIAALHGRLEESVIRAQNASLHYTLTWTV